MLNPMRLKDYVTLGNILGGVASMIASMEGSIDWAAYWMLIAWIFDSFDGLVARLTGGGNKFGEVFDNVADLVAYSLAPTFLIYLAYHMPKEFGGAGWPVWAAAVLASLPTLFGCIRFARNNVKDIIMPEFHLGLPRTVYALCIASLFCSHVFKGSWMTDGSQANAVLYWIGAAFILVISFLTFTLHPFHAKPKKPSGSVMFCAMWFLITTPIGFIVGTISKDLRIFFDVLFFNFNVYTFLGWTIIPAEKRKEVRDYVDRLVQEFKSEMNPKKA
jgi:CDP-diacylglycerol---serine O-phosphatidyltransferase